MIKEKITVSFAYNPIDNYWWLESDNLSEKYRKNAYHSTFYEKTFFSFKNNHELSLRSKKALPSTYYVDGPNFYSGPNKISMPESFKQRIFSKATELLEERLDICSDRQADTFRALLYKTWKYVEEYEFSTYQKDIFFPSLFHLLSSALVF